MVTSLCDCSYSTDSSNSSDSCDSFEISDISDSPGSVFCTSRLAPLGGPKQESIRAQMLCLSHNADGLLTSIQRFLQFLFAKQFVFGSFIFCIFFLNN